MAAAAATMQPTHAGPAGPSHHAPKSHQPFDARLLSSKLELAKLQQDAGHPQRRREERASFSGHSYVPRNAAKQFASTTTPLPPDSQKTLPQRARSLHVPKPKSDRIEAHESGMNPKQLMANLSIGMSETEAMNMVEQGRKASKSSNRYSMPPTAEEGTVESGRPTRKASVTESGRATRKASVTDSGQQYTYKPGEPLARHEKRRSLLHSANVNQALEHYAAQPGSSIPVALPPHDQPDFFRKSLDDVPEFRQIRERDNEMPYLMPMEDGPSLDSHGRRPKIPDAHDRNDWSQRSQVGDDMRHLLNMPLMRKKQRAHEAGDKQKPADRRGSGSQQGSARPDTLLRQKSAGDLPEDGDLVGNAVKQIKQDQKNKRRQSLLNPFRRLLH